MRSALVLIVATLVCTGIATSEVVEVRKVNGKTVMCMHSGLISDLNDCGNKSDWYSYVFVGYISSIRLAEGDEKVIEIVPEEVFSGKPDTPMTVLTSQGLCLPKLTVGDRWLFYLRKVKGKPIILDYYGNDSLPVADAQEKINTLRRLKSVGDSAILRGRVVRGNSWDGKAVVNVSVVAHRHSDKKEFIAVTDANGRYEFQPLPPGSYRFTSLPIGSIKRDNFEIDLNAGTCWDMTFSGFPNTQLK